jgi:hypothetical protein
VVFLFLLNNLTQRTGGVGVDFFEGRNLLAEMAKHNALDSHSCRGDCSTAKKSCDGSKRQAAESAQMIAAAPSQSASFKHGAKPSAMALLMGAEVV